MQIDVTTLTITRALRHLQAGDFSAHELTAACLSVIEARNPTLNAFALLTPPSAEPAASNLGPLGGIPLAVKDLIDLAGYPTRGGSPLHFGDSPALKDAAVVQKIKQAGAVILGKTNTHEIALGITGINPHSGAVRNPHDPSRITGGSSSGSAAAVASGMVLGALGTDTGGSIRIPSALCGVVGLKPTFGRVSMRGVLPLSWNLDHAGPITRSVEDAALLLEVLSGYDPRDPASVDAPPEPFRAHLAGGVRGWRLALAAGSYIEESDPGVLAAVQSAAQVFAHLGAEVIPVEIPRLREAAAANGTMVIADAAAFHRERLAAHPEWFGPDVRERLERGRVVTSTEYILARRTQQEMRRYFELFFAEYDALLLPTTAAVAAPIEGLDSAAYAPRLTRFTAPFNLTGLPALTIPCGQVNGLPVGLQIVGAPWQESKVLQVGYAFEMARD